MYHIISFKFCFLLLKFYNFTIYNIQIFIYCLKFRLIQCDPVTNRVGFRLKKIIYSKNWAGSGFDLTWINPSFEHPYFIMSKLQLDLHLDEPWVFARWTIEN